MAIQGRQDITNVTINIGNSTPFSQNIGSPLTTDADDRKQISNYDAYEGLTQSGLDNYQQGDSIVFGTVINNTFIVESGTTITGSGLLVVNSGTIVNNSITNTGTFLSLRDAPYSIIPASVSTSQDTATYNTNVLKQLFSNTKLGVSGSQIRHDTIYLPGYGFVINDTIIIEPQIALRIQGGGGFGTVAYEAFYNQTDGAPNYGGNPCRPIWVGPSNKGMFVNKSAGTVIDNINLQGRLFTSTEYNNLLAHWAASGELLYKDEYAQFGLMTLNREADYAFGPGKIQSPRVATFACQTGLIFGSGAITGDNADESSFDYYSSQFCNVGFATRTQNAQLFNFGYFIPSSTKTGIYIEYGGNIHITHAVAIAKNSVFCRLGDIDVNTPLVHIDMLSVDNNFQSGLLFGALSHTAKANITIDTMFCANGIVTGLPLFDLMGSISLKIDSAFNLHERCIKFTSVSGLNFNGSINNARMKFVGNHNPNNLIHLGSTGTGYLTHRDCYNHSGVPFNSNRYSWTNGVQANVTGF